MLRDANPSDFAGIYIVCGRTDMRLASPRSPEESKPFGIRVFQKALCELLHLVCHDVVGFEPLHGERFVILRLNSA